MNIITGKEEKHKPLLFRPRNMIKKINPSKEQILQLKYAITGSVHTLQSFKTPNLKVG